MDFSTRAVPWGVTGMHYFQGKGGIGRSWRGLGLTKKTISYGLHGLNIFSVRKWWFCPIIQRQVLLLVYGKVHGVHMGSGEVFGCFWGTLTSIIIEISSNFGICWKISIKKYREEIDMHLIGLRLHISYVAALPFLGGPRFQIFNLQMVLIGVHNGPI